MAGQLMARSPSALGWVRSDTASVIEAKAWVTRGSRAAPCGESLIAPASRMNNAVFKVFSSART